jgi:hypothetical protein
MPEYTLIQFDLPIPDDITLRFTKALCKLAHDGNVILNKPIGCPISKPSGKAYTDSTFHAQTYRAIAARKAGAAWTKNYPELDLYAVKYIQRRTRLVLMRHAANAKTSPASARPSV